MEKGENMQYRTGVEDSNPVVWIIALTKQPRVRYMHKCLACGAESGRSKYSLDHKCTKCGNYTVPIARTRASRVSKKLLDEIDRIRMDD